MFILPAPTRTKNKKRILILYIICGVIFVLLCARLGWIMLVDGKEYSDRAIKQHTKDTSIFADRGIIYDRNMNELALNAPTFTVWVRPAELKEKKGDADEIASILASVTGEKKASVKALLKKKSTLVRVTRGLNADQAEKLRKYMSDGKLAGISIDESVSRYYPGNEFASTFLGYTNDSNEGVNGVERYYDNYLGGKSGRIIRNTDASGRMLSYGTEKIYKAEDGLNVVLTIDQVLQQYLDDALKLAYKNTVPTRAMAVAMDVNTGEILAMSEYPGYDLNNPRVPVTEEGKEEFEELETEQERVEYWNQMWRNFMVSDTYEPGSTFKLITTAIALEEGVTDTSETFNCIGYYRISSDTMLKCHSYKNPHGVQSLAQAVQHSCNPVFVNLALRIGAVKYYEYLDNLGFTTKTGIDLPGETSAILYNREAIGPAELGVMSYGQGIGVTPIQLITALSSIANGGYLRAPHIVKEIVNDDGEVIYKNETKIVRRTFSEETSKEMCEIMKSVVDVGTGKRGYIPGYRVGGKTGTATKVVNGKYAKGKVWCSFVGVAPTDDPQIMVLLIVDEPKGGASYGSTAAVPYVKTFLEDALVYMQVEPKYTDSEKMNIAAEKVWVPNFTGQTVSSAVATIQGKGLKVEVMPSMPEDPTAVKVVDQYPKVNSRASAGSTVFIYTE